MGAIIEDCAIDMEIFQSLEADVRMKDCVGIWAAPLWQKPVFLAQGKVNGVYYTTKDSAESMTTSRSARYRTRTRPAQAPGQTSAPRMAGGVGRRQTPAGWALIARIGTSTGRLRTTTTSHNT